MGGSSGLYENPLGLRSSRPLPPFPLFMHEYPSAGYSRERSANSPSEFSSASPFLAPIHLAEDRPCPSLGPPFETRYAMLWVITIGITRTSGAVLGFAPFTLQELGLPGGGCPPFTVSAVRCQRGGVDVCPPTLNTAFAAHHPYFLHRLLPRP